MRILEYGIKNAGWKRQDAQKLMRTIEQDNLFIQ